MNAVNRKEFLKRAGLLAGAISFSGQIIRTTSGASLLDDQPTTPTGARAHTIYRVSGLPGVRYNRGFEKLCRYGRFDSFSAAVASVRNPQTEFLVFCD